MRYLTIFALAGLLTACTAADKGAVVAPAPAPLLPGCNGAPCVVLVKVDEGKILPVPILEVTGNQVVIRFRLVTPGYEFAKDPKKPIEFKTNSKKEAAKQFSQAFRGAGKHLMLMFDLNSKHDGAEYEYLIKVDPEKGGDTITLDPMIINK